MRGDSLRDFYAKTMAVLGLGLLACAGAVVDYWPVSGDLPTTPAVTGLAPSTPVLVQNLDQTIPAPTFVRAGTVRPRPADLITNVISETDLLASAAAPVATLYAAPLPENLIVLDASPVASGADEEIGLDPAPISDSLSVESRRLFSDSLRRTKVGIAAARILLNDAVSGAMSGFVGAFRKVSPFFQTTGVTPGLD